MIEIRLDRHLEQDATYDTDGRLQHCERLVLILLIVQKVSDPIHGDSTLKQEHKHAQLDAKQELNWGTRLGHICSNCKGIYITVYLDFFLIKKVFLDNPDSFLWLQFFEKFVDPFLTYFLEFLDIYLGSFVRAVVVARLVFVKAVEVVVLLMIII